MLENLSFIIFLFLIILLLFNYSCLHFPPPQPNLPPSLTSTFPLSFVHVSFIVVLENPSPRYPLPPPLWLLSDCSYFQCLWLYFACFFLLLIMFQLKVRSYICPLPPGEGTFFKKLLICLFIFREMKGGRKRGRETSVCGCLSHAPYWGPGLQPRHAPWLGIELATFCFTDQHSIHWATPAGVIEGYF